MLKRMREGGDKTPVLMLTSESKRSIMVDVMKLGIEDYILKPFKPEELKAKIVKVLKIRGGSDIVEGTATAAPHVDVSAPRETATQGKQFIDVCVIDDMENVQKKLRGFLPNHLSLNGCTSAHSALSMARERVYRVVLVDTEIPDVNSVALMNQIRLLQPHAALIALSLRTVGDAEKQAEVDGYDGCLLKPFNQNNIEDFLLRFFDNQEVLFVEDNVLKTGANQGGDDRVERYYRRLATLIPPALEKVAAACFDDVILDITQAPLRPDHTPRLLIEMEKQAKHNGLGLRLVGTKEGQALLKQFSDTATIAFHASLADARNAA
jgi:two-component system cell cycle response regulator